jgi:histidyl-tRNA synthetase
MANKISLESYKGVRDFYPEEQAVQNYIFNTWRKTLESFGYLEYNASVLEPLELYKSKSSEEIVNEQLYSFKDKGERDVVLRPEMTPTVSRMIAGKWQELPAPIRWYSIQNFFRYEKPQKGRLREFWQLNADIFGTKNKEVDTEIIFLAYKAMQAFGATENLFEIRINNREMMNDLYEKVGIAADERQKISRIIDKKDKISKEAFSEALKEVVGEGKMNKLSYIIGSGDQFFEEFKETTSVKETKAVIENLKARGINNIKFAPTLTRGFDYYTGIIFELFDTDPENPRSIVGGGRYDNLVGAFAGENVPAIGFGWGDVVMKDFLEVHNLLPKLKSSTNLWICIAPETNIEQVEKIAEELREKGVNVGVDISGKKLPDQLKSIERRNIPFVMVIGKDEIESGKFKVRNAETREEKEGSLDDICKFVTIR